MGSSELPFSGGNQEPFGETKPSFDLEEAKSVLPSLSLMSVTFGDYLIVMRSDFDVTIEGEPYLALMLLYDTRDGKFMARIWNQTVFTGSAPTLEQFVGACEKHFSGKPCLGYPEDEDEHSMQEFFVSQTPIPRKISKTCLRVLGKEVGGEVHSCNECLKLKDLKMMRELNAAAKCKVEILSDTEEPAEPEEPIRPKKRKRSKVAKIKYKEEEEEEEEDPSWDGKTDLDEDYGYGYSNVDTKAVVSENGQAPKIKCPWCSQMFSKGSGTFATHRKTKHFWGLFKCVSCSFRAHFANDLVFHMQQEEHTEEPSINCPKCKVKFPMLEVGPHYEECVSEGITKCTWCNKKFNGMSGGLDMHRKKIHFWGVFKCLQCKAIVNFAKDLIEHMEQEEHMRDPFANCPKCKERFPVLEVGPHYEECLFDQVKKDKDTQCPICLDVVSINYIYHHKKMKHFWGVFKCPTCHFRADFAADVIKHMEETLHVDDPLVNCPTCKEKYPMAEIGPHYEDCVVTDLRQKAIEKKQKKKPLDITCATCGKLFKRREHYKRHIKIHFREQGVTEEDAKMTLYHFCDRCGKKFTEHNTLLYHIKAVHEGIKTPSTCPVCLLTFDNQSKMYRHKIMEHATDHKYTCQQCGYRCVSAQHLKLHFTKHEDPKFKCNYCEKMLKSRKTLIVHEREHTGERPFKCNVCGNGYKSGSVLSLHKKEVHKILTPRMKPIEKRVRKNKDM